MEDILYKSFDYEIKQADESDLTVQHFISTERRDRIGDRMHASGMMIDGIPVVLLGHGKEFMGTEPIAKPEWIRPGTYKRHRGIEAKTQFYDDEQGIGRRLWGKTKDKFMPNWSLGYGIKDATPFKDKGLDITKWYLFEYSLVGVSMNPDANTIKDGGLLVKYLPESFINRLSNDDGILKTCSVLDKTNFYTDNLVKTLDEINYCSKDIEENKNKSFYSQNDLDIEAKAIIPYKKTPLADEGTQWDAGAQVKAADISDLKIMSVWYDAENSDTKSAYKGPHHMAEAPHKTVKAGVVALAAAIMGARGGIDIPASDMAGVKAHVKKHYQDFDLGEPPWEKKAYTLYEKAISENDIYSAVLISMKHFPEIWDHFKLLDSKEHDPTWDSIEDETSEKIYSDLKGFDERIKDIEGKLDTFIDAIDDKFKQYADIAKKIEEAPKERKVIFRMPEKKMESKKEEVKVPKKMLDKIIAEITAKNIKEFRKYIGKVD